MDERELLETILTAEVLILAQILENNPTPFAEEGTNYEETAINRIKGARMSVIQRLKSVF